MAIVFAVLLRFTDYHFGIFKPQYITIYNTFIYVGAHNTEHHYGIVQYHPYDTIETWGKDFYHYFVYFPFDVFNEYVSYHVGAEMIPIIANR